MGGPSVAEDSVKEVMLLQAITTFHYNTELRILFLHWKVIRLESNPITVLPETTN